MTDCIGVTLRICDARCEMCPDAPACATCEHTPQDHQVDQFGERRIHCWQCACPRYTTPIA